MPFKSLWLSCFTHRTQVSMKMGVKSFFFFVFHKNLYEFEYLINFCTTGKPFFNHTKTFPNNLFLLVCLFERYQNFILLFKKKKKN